MTAEAKLALALIVNGKPMTTAATNLAGLLGELGYRGARVATARNGDFVPAPARAATVLRCGDQIEIVSPRHGG